MPAIITVNAIAYEDDGMWIAQCLEYDLVSCTETLEELPNELVRQVRAVVAADLEAGRQPLSTFGPAPAKFWAMFELVKRSKPLKSVAAPLPFRAKRSLRQTFLERVRERVEAMIAARRAARIEANLFQTEEQAAA